MVSGSTIPCWFLLKCTLKQQPRCFWCLKVRPCCDCCTGFSTRVSQRTVWLLVFTLSPTGTRQPWPSVGKRRRVQLAPLVEIAVLYEQKPDFCCLQQTSGNFIFTHRHLAALLFVFYWVYRSSLQPGAVFLSPLSCLTSLLMTHRRIERQTDRQTHKPQKQTESRHLHSQHRVEKKVNGLELLWAVVKELCRKRIKTLNLMCGQLNQTGIFFFNFPRCHY